MVSDLQGRGIYIYTLGGGFISTGPGKKVQRRGI